MSKRFGRAGENVTIVFREKKTDQNAQPTATIFLLNGTRRTTHDRSYVVVVMRWMMMMMGRRTRGLQRTPPQVVRTFGSSRKNSTPITVDWRGVVGRDFSRNISPRSDVRFTT